MLRARTYQEDIAGLDMTDRYISVARLVMNGRNRIVLCNAGWVEVDPDATDHERALAIRRLWKQCGLSTYTVCSCFRSRKLLTRRFDFPGSSVGELNALLQTELTDLLGAGHAPYFLDWHLDADSVAGSENCRGLFVAAPQVDVDRHLALLNLAGLYPAVLDIASTSIANLYLELNGPPDEGETIGLVNLSDHSADVALLSGGPQLHAYTAISLSEPWENNLDYLAGNVRDLLEYARHKLHWQSVDRLLFTGREIPLDFIRERLGLEGLLETWDPSVQLSSRIRSRKSRHQLSEQQGQLLTTSLGAALRRVNHAAV
ncbi:MAG: Tfp pilus assembly PilM family ATPase [Verrucomicrobiales bacterium]|jgi:Tfp pilus assembly PilM family ATPase